jgi:HSP20 family protein
MSNLIRVADQLDWTPGIRWEPFRLMHELLAWDPFADAPPMARPGELAGFVPRCDVHEAQDHFVFTADVPGVEEKDLEITLTGNRLTVAGTRAAEERQASDAYHCVERSYGTFRRTFSLPDGADPERCQAELRDGVLCISVGKKAEHQPRKIALKKTIGERVRGLIGGKDAEAS